MKTTKLSELSSFYISCEAKEKLKQMDFGYVIKIARLYRDTKNTHIFGLNSIFLIIEFVKEPYNTSLKTGRGIQVYAF